MKLSNYFGTDLFGIALLERMKTNQVCVIGYCHGDNTY